MFGFLIALALFGLQFLINRELLETAFVNSVLALTWWYAAAGVITVSLAALVWAGDLGTEGARLRHGVSSSLAWMLGLPRVSLHRKGVLYFLLLRRTLLALGSYLLMQGLQPAGATFIWDESFLWAGGALLAMGLMAFLFVPLLRKIIASTHQIARANEVSSTLS